MRRDVALSAFAGLLLALSFPSSVTRRARGSRWCRCFSLSGWTGWPVRCRAPRRCAVLLGLVTSVVFFCGTLYWTGPCSTFGGLPAPLGVVSVLLRRSISGLCPWDSSARRHPAPLRRRGLWLAPAAWVSGEPCGDAAVRLRGWFWRRPDRRAPGGAAGQRGRMRRVAVRRLRQPRWRPRCWRAARCVGLAGTAAVLVAVALWGTWRIADGALTREGSPVASA